MSRINLGDMAAFPQSRWVQPRVLEIRSDSICNHVTRSCTKYHWGIWRKWVSILKFGGCFSQSINSWQQPSGWTLWISAVVSWQSGYTVTYRGPRVHSHPGHWETRHWLERTSNLFSYSCSLLLRSLPYSHDSCLFNKQRQLYCTDDHAVRIRGLYRNIIFNLILHYPFGLGYRIHFIKRKGLIIAQSFNFGLYFCNWLVLFLLSDGGYGPAILRFLGESTTNIFAYALCSMGIYILGILMQRFVNFVKVRQLLK